jgi:hypothetical protein
MNRCALPRRKKGTPLRVLRIGAAKGAGHLPGHHRSTPDTVWGHYGFTRGLI